MAESLALSTEKNCEENLNKPALDVDECPVVTAIDVIGGKWKVIILYNLRDNTLRFGELKKLIPHISQKTLTTQLRSLEADKLVARKVYAEVPPRVEYTATPLAEQLRPVLDALCEWGQAYRQAHQS